MTFGASLREKTKGKTLSGRKQRRQLAEYKYSWQKNTETENLCVPASLREKTISRKTENYKIVASLLLCGLCVKKTKGKTLSGRKQRRQLAEYKNS